MKKFLLATLLLALSTVPTLRAQQKITSADLVGLWQTTVKDKYGGTHYASMFKEMFADGTFHLFMQTSEGDARPFVITNRGTYTVLNDTTIREHINASVTNGDVIGRDNDLTVSISDNKKMLYVTYYMPGSPDQGREVWVRVEMPKVDKVPSRQKSL